jgi:hypothetical protein
MAAAGVARDPLGTLTSTASDAPATLAPRVIRSNPFGTGFTEGRCAVEVSSVNVASDMAPARTCGAALQRLVRAVAATAGPVQQTGEEACYVGVLHVVSRST